MTIRTAPEILRSSAERFPERTALVFQGRRLSYRELDEASDRLALALTAWGVSPGERVVLAAGNSPEVVIALFGVWKAGGVAFHLDPSLPPEVLARVVERARARVVIVETAREAMGTARSGKPGRLERIVVCGGDPSAWSKTLGPFIIEPLSALTASGEGNGADGGADLSPGDPDALACVSYTSGSTGLPRGVQLTHRNLVRNVELNVRYLEIGSEDRACLVLPLFFGMNRASLLAYFQVGATVVLERGFVDPNGVLDAVRREDATSLSAVPSILVSLLARGNLKDAPLPSLRSVRIGAGSVRPELVQALLDAFPGVRIQATYGLTEVGLVAVMPPEQILRRAGSCGRVLPEITLRVDGAVSGGQSGAGAGEIVVKAPHAALGYEGDEEATRAVFRADGIHTGDLGWIDPEGFLFLVGRSKDLIKSGSENILPGEVEEHLLRHPAVAECAVVGVPDAWLGEAVQAFVVPAPGRSLDAQDLLKFCRREMSPIKRPKHVIICQGLPKTPNGKVDRRALQQMISSPERGSR